MPLEETSARKTEWKITEKNNVKRTKDMSHVKSAVFRQR